MTNFSKKITVFGAALLCAVAASSAHALPTLVQFQPAGTGTGVDGSYATTGIHEFDWQSSGDVTIPDLLPVNANYSGGGGGSTNSFSTWAANAGNGDTITFDLHAQTRLNDMLNLGGGSILNDMISTDGTASGCANGANCKEITSALSATETAVLFGNQLIFLSITGDYAFFISDADSDVATGAGFINGDEILSGKIIESGGSFTAGQGGSIFLTNTVTAYDDSYIQTDPDANAPLIGTTFDSLMSLVSIFPGAVDNGHEAAASDAGDVVGLNGYVVLASDLSIKGDANNEFSVPEPGTMLLLGAGLLGLGATARRRKQAA